MKRILLFLSLSSSSILLIFLISLFSPKYVSAQLCEMNATSPCTYCMPNSEFTACVVDTGYSYSCQDAGLFPDPAFCDSLTGGSDCNAGSPSGNCIAAAVCDDEGDTCTGSPNQGSCCNGLICDQTLHCATPATCVPDDGTPCVGQVNQQGNCCAGLICNNWTFSGLTCETPPNVIGYFCAGGGQCNPCYPGAANAACNPPSYCIQPNCSGGFPTQAAAYAACDAACGGAIPIRFRCGSGGCIEDASGPYEGIAACQSVCGPGGNASQAFFCNPSSGAASTNPDDGGINTAIGCIPLTTPQAFTVFLLRWGMGIAGGVAIVLIAYAGFLVITSGGNPQKLQAGKELLTAAITGLLLLVFGAFILEFIGVQVLNIPGFGQ